MTKIRNFEDVNKVLHDFVPPSNHVAYNLKNMRALMDALGNPQDTYKTVHVAGTSGKTSTSYYIASLLKAAGKKVGLTVSPHLDEVNERVQINLTPLPEAEFCEELTEFLSILNKLSIKPSYFELLIAFAYWEFARQKVDYAVVEVGLGGLLDGTNIITNPQKVCVITDIGYDHVQKLGRTLPEITAQKAGIIQAQNAVIMHEQNEAVMQAVAKTVQAKHAQLIMVDKNEHLAFVSMPYFQRRNWQLAFAVYQYIASRDGLNNLDEAAIHASMRTIIPGRMEVVQLGASTLIMDGAHNEQKMRAFVASFGRAYPGKKAAILLSLKEDKEYQSVLPLLLPICSQLIITTFDIVQDLPVKSIKPSILAEAAQDLGFKNVQAVEDPIEAFHMLQETAEELQIVTGSFYLLSCIRPELNRVIVDL